MFTIANKIALKPLTAVSVGYCWTISIDSSFWHFDKKATSDFFFVIVVFNYTCTQTRTLPSWSPETAEIVQRAMHMLLELGLHPVTTIPAKGKSHLVGSWLLSLHLCPVCDINLVVTGLLGHGVRGLMSHKESAM